MAAVFVSTGGCAAIVRTVATVEELHAQKVDARWGGATRRCSLLAAPAVWAAGRQGSEYCSGVLSMDKKICNESVAEVAALTVPT